MSWADLMPLIFDRLFPLLTERRDRVCLSSVCRSWRASRLQRPVQNPITFDRTHNDRRCFGAIQNWLLFDDFSYSGFPYFLNARTRDVFHLPRWCWKIRRPQQDAIISSAPTDASCTIVFLLARGIVHCKVGDWAWSYCRAGTEIRSCTGTYFNKRFYIIDQDQKLGVIDLEKGNDAVTWLELDVDPLRQHVRPPAMYGMQVLVECSGRLLVVLVQSAVAVFSADLEERRWREVKDLEDRSLFLAPGGSVSKEAVSVGWHHNRICLALTGPAESERRWAQFQHRDGNIWSATDSSGFLARGGSSSRWLFL